MDRSSLPSDGPDAALARVAELLRMPDAPADIARALAAHPRPSSLLALVDVATAMGLKVTAAKSEASSFDELPLPLIAHFDGGEGGFGVVESVSPEGVGVWDSRNGLRALDRDRFDESWSGVVALVERGADTPGSKAAYLRGRLGRRIGGSLEPPAVAGGRGAPLLRAVIAALLGALLVAAVAAQSPSDRVASAMLVALTLAGLSATIAMSVAIASYGGPFSPGICRRGRFVDCESVLTSRFARVLGFPLSDLGISFYGAVLISLAVGATAGGPVLWWTVGAAFLVTLPVAAILIGIQIAMRRVCTLCLAVHLVNVAAAATFWIRLRDAAPTPGSAVTAALFLALAFCLVLLFVIPSFKTHDALAQLSLTHGRMAASPFAGLAQLTTASTVPLNAPEVAVELGASSADHVLVVFVHPSCRQCDPVLRELQSLVAGGRVRAFAGIAPKDRDEADRRLSEAIVAFGLAHGPEIMLRAYAVAKSDYRSLLAGDPLTLIATKLSIGHDEVVGYADEAREMIHHTQAFAAEHVEGTPAIFFNGRPYSGLLPHLLFLLERHPELLK